MSPAAGLRCDLQQFRPSFSVALYHANVDVAGNHLGGLLFIKKMADSSTRLVFSNEMGFTFFDFEFDSAGVFKVHSATPKMNKKPVLKTLRQDFELILMMHMDTAAAIRRDENVLYHIFPKQKGFNYYVTDTACKGLIRLERASNKKVIVQAMMKNYINGIPDTIGISHNTFDFTIGLKRVER